MEGREVPSSHSSQIFLLATHTSHAAPPLVQSQLTHSCAVGVLDQMHEAWRGRHLSHFLQKNSAKYSCNNAQDDTSSTGCCAAAAAAGWFKQPQPIDAQNQAHTLCSVRVLCASRSDWPPRLDRPPACRRYTHCGASTEALLSSESYLANRTQLRLLRGCHSRVRGDASAVAGCGGGSADSRLRCSVLRYTKVSAPRPAARARNYNGTEL